MLFSCIVESCSSMVFKDMVDECKNINDINNRLYFKISVLLANSI